MALKLVKPGPVTRRGVVRPGSGWANVTGADPNNLDNPYWFGHSGHCLMTVTAWNVDGLRILEWGKDRFLESRFPGAAHSISGVLDLSQRSAVVRALNPTDKAEIVINWVPLSLSLSLFVEFAAAWLRRWHHGAKACAKRPGGVFLQRGEVGNHGRHPGRLAYLGAGPYLPAARRVLAGVDGNLNRGVTPFRNRCEDCPAESGERKRRRLPAVHVREKGRRAHAHLLVCPPVLSGSVHARPVDHPVGHMERADRPVDRKGESWGTKGHWHHPHPWQVSSRTNWGNRPVLERRRLNLNRHHQPDRGERGHSACLLGQDTSHQRRHHTTGLTRVGGGHRGA